MKILKDYDIENTVAVLQEAIENKKRQSLHDQAGASTAMSHLFSASRISNALGDGGEFVQELFKKAQQSIEENPWQVLRKVAVSSFAVGVFLNLRLRKPSAGNKK